MPCSFATRSIWPLLAMLSAAVVSSPPSAQAKGGGGGGGAGSAIEDSDSEFDDSDNVPKQRGSKAPSHFAIKFGERLGARYQFDNAFSLEPYVRGQQGMLDNPFAIRSATVAGGLTAVYKFGDTAWTTSFETKDSFSKFYAHTTYIAENLQTSIAQPFDFGNSGFAIVPRFRVGYQWANEARQERWKFELTAPVGYQVTDTLILFPVMPKISYQPYTDRSDHRADLTVNVSAGVRYAFNKAANLQAAFGFENRWSNVPSVEYSRWILAPQVAFRLSF